MAPVLSEEAPGILFFLPGESGTHRYPYFKRFCLSLPGPPGTSPRPSLAPESWISRQRFAAPRWPLEEKQGLVLRARSRRAVWLAGFRRDSFTTLLRPPQTSLLISLRLFPLVQPLSHLWDTVHPSPRNHPVPPGPRAFPQATEGRHLPPHTVPLASAPSSCPGSKSVPFPGITFLVRD